MKWLRVFAVGVLVAWGYYCLHAPDPGSIAPPPPVPPAVSP